MKINPGQEPDHERKRVRIAVGRDQSRRREKEIRTVFYYSIFPNMLLSLHPNT